MPEVGYTLGTGFVCAALVPLQVSATEQQHRPAAPATGRMEVQQFLCPCGCSVSVLEDAVSAGADQERSNDENNAQEDLSLDKLNDADNRENHGDNP
jgi:hypothetical protein